MANIGESRYFHIGEVKDKDMGEMAAVAMLAASPDTGFTRPIGPPKDSGNVAWFIFFLLGVGVLTPWNAFILAADYFEFLYPDKYPESVFPVAYMVPNLLFLVALLKFSEVLPPKFRIISGFIGFLLVLLAIPFLDLIVLNYESCDNKLDNEFMDCEGSSATDIKSMCMSVADFVESNSDSGYNFALTENACDPYDPSEPTDPTDLEILQRACKVIKLFDFNEEIYLLEEEGGDDIVLIDQETPVIPDCDDEDFSRAITEVGAPSTLFVFTVLVVIVNGLADALAQGSLFGIASNMPPRYTQALVSGVSMSGLILSIMRIIIKASLPQDGPGLRMSAFIYFFFASGIIALCLGAYSMLYALPIVRYYRHIGISAKNFKANKQELVQLRKEKEQKGEDPWSVTGDKKKNSQILILGKIYHFAAQVSLIYAVTLSIFPGAISQDLHSRIFDDGWYSVLLLSTFNVFDFVGKMLPTFPSLVYTDVPTLWSFTLGRVLLLPAFVLLAEGIITHESYSFTLIVLLGVSNGYISSLAFMAAPSHVDDHEKESAGQQMVFFLIFGLLTGASVGFLWLLGK